MIHSMRCLQYVQFMFRAGDTGPQQFGARGLRGQVFSGVDPPGGALGEGPCAPLGDPKGLGEGHETSRPSVLFDKGADSGLGGLRHVRGKG
jgi:hypothetical protein